MSNGSIPERIGKYVILGKIAEGGFAVVYRGRDPFIKREVAVKTCSVIDEELRRRFYREAEIAGSLHHRNVTIVHDFGVDGDFAYLVQELLSGEDLLTVIRRRDKMPLVDRIDILIQVAMGLAHAHSRGVIHRDVKPGNIRILENNHVKIMDFGIAKLSTAHTQLTQQGMTVGTVNYLAPEQIRDGKVTERTDIFSFGIVAYEFLTYTKPFQGTNIAELIPEILTKHPKPITELIPEYPRSLWNVVERCLGKEPSGRFSSFNEVIAHLRPISKEITLTPNFKEDTKAVLGEDEVPSTEEKDPLDDTQPVEIDADVVSQAMDDLGESDAEEGASEGSPLGPPDPLGASEVKKTTTAEPKSVMPKSLSGLAATVVVTEEELVKLSRADSPDSVANLKKSPQKEKAQKPLSPTVKPLVKSSTPEKAPAPTPGSPSPKPPAGDKEGPKSKLWMVGVAALFVGLAVVGLWLFSPGSKPAPEPSIAPKPTVSTPEVVEPIAPPQPTTGLLRVTSSPWSEIVSISQNGEVVMDLGNPTTPWSREISFGTYDIALRLSGTEEEHLCTVEVTPEGGQCDLQIQEDMKVLDYFKETGWWD